MYEYVIWKSEVNDKTDISHQNDIQKKTAKCEKKLKNQELHESIMNAFKLQMRNKFLFLPMSVDVKNK